MNCYICCGKGGVGKTNSAVALGLYLSAQGEKTAIIDFDGGHSVKNTLGTKAEFTPNTICEVRKNLSVAVIENILYVGIAEAKEQKMPLKKYLAQFPADHGLIPLADMINAFFGVPTDVVTLQKFSGLVNVLLQLSEQKYRHVVIDVEPTAGLERLLSSVTSTTRSLINLKNQGLVSLTVIGAKWPDIAGYLKGDYIRNADKYSANLDWTAAFIKNAAYFIVTTPEAGPVSQTHEVRSIIEKFGGRIHGYIANNMRGEGHEEATIARLDTSNCPVVRIHRQKEFHDGNGDPTALLTHIGEKLARGILFSRNHYP